jgi:hypothetical protein
MKNSNISPCQNILIFMKKKSSKQNTKNPSTYLYNNSILTNLSSFNTSQKNILSFKNPHIENRPIIIIIIYLGAKIPLRYYYILYNESNHNISFAYHGKPKQHLQTSLQHHLLPLLVNLFPKKKLKIDLKLFSITNSLFLKNICQNFKIFFFLFF